MKKLVLLVTIGLLAALAPHASWGEGTEALGAASLPLEPGSGIISAGAGMESGSGVIDLAVPANASVEQVILYYEGQHRSAQGDDQVLVDGNPVQADLIGGPAFFFNLGGDVFASSYRADITGLNLVAPGANSVTISEIDFDAGSAGAGLLVVVNDGKDIADIQVRDGVDNAYAFFPEPRKSTVAQTFDFAPADFPRTADLVLMVGSVGGPDRPNHLLLTVGGGPTQTIVNPLSSAEGPEWDNPTLPVDIPAGASSLTVQLVSAEDDDGLPENPASLEWVAAALSVKTCPPLSDTRAETEGAAYALDAEALGIDLADEVAASASDAPDGPTSDAAGPVASLNVPGVGSADLLFSQSSSGLDPSTTTSTATLADINLLGGRVTADTITAVSQSTASTTGASYSSAGSTIEGLEVNGNPVNVTPNTSVKIKGLFNTTLAEVHIYEESGTSSIAGPTSSASHSVNMIRIEVLRSGLGLVPGTTIVVGHAQTSAQSPTGGCPSLASVSGEAFTTSVDGNLGGIDLVGVKVGEAVLPATGGSDSDATAANVAGVATSATASNTTSGSLAPSPNATARSLVEGVSLLGGVVTADVLDVSATSSADGVNADTTFAVTLANLNVNGTTVESDVAPNSTFTVSLDGGDLLVLTVNSQVEAGNGTTDTEGTVAAIHARVFSPDGSLLAEIIVASAHSDAHL